MHSLKHTVKYTLKHTLMYTVDYQVETLSLIWPKSSKSRDDVSYFRKNLT